jgi:solute carrier family 35 (adenosine 3'-phospho 5'-phosphosulfate transporter), member B2
VLKGALCRFGIFAESIRFMLRDSFLLRDVALLSLCSTFIQLLVYQIIKNFNAVTYSTIMTTRQMISIFLSSLLFQNALSFWQLYGTFLVTGALYLKAYFSYIEQREQQQQKLSLPLYK